MERRVGVSSEKAKGASNATAGLDSDADQSFLDGDGEAGGARAAVVADLIFDRVDGKGLISGLIYGAIIPGLIYKYASPGLIYEMR